MAKKTRAQIQGELATDLPDNTTGAITEQKLREEITDLADSALFFEDVPGLNPTAPIMIVVAGQSNAQGANAGGPNPADPRVKVWDFNAGAWGSSDYTVAPLSGATPHGNGGNNNIGLALAHRFVDMTGRPAFVVYDAAGGTSIDAWVASGTASARYAALKGKIEAALATPEFSGIAQPQMAIIWAQGEEDFGRDFAMHLGDLNTLIAQFRAESWFAPNTPFLMAEMSPLHNRYAPQAAIRRLGTQGDAWVVSVNSAGLVTSDATHWDGASLWEFGYYRMWAAYWTAPRTVTVPDPVFLTRLGEPAGDGDAIVVCKFDSLISAEANASLVSTGTIAWGFNVAVDGNYSVGFGYDTAVGNLANYGFASGRACTLTDNADYAFVTGYQCTIDNDYGFGAGRGHTVADLGGFAAGLFSEYTLAQTDEVLFQIGIGTSSGNRKNALTARKSGIIETKHLPSHADDAAAGTAGLTAGQWYATPAGELRIKL